MNHIDKLKDYRCKDCKYLDLEDARYKGFKCHRPHWFWAKETTQYKFARNKACKGFVKREAE